MSKKMTPWFSADQPPTRDGAYQVDRYWFSWFQNGRFHGCWEDPEMAQRAFFRDGGISEKDRAARWSEVAKWRGLAGAPK